MPAYPRLNTLDLTTSEIQSLNHISEKVVDIIRTDKEFPGRKGYEVVQVDAILHDKPIHFTTHRNFY